MASTGSYVRSGRDSDPRRRMIDYEANNSFYRRVEDKQYGLPESPISLDSNSDSSNSSIDYRYEIAPSRQYDSRVTLSPEIQDTRFSYQDQDIGRVERHSESKSNFNSPADLKTRDHTVDSFSSIYRGDKDGARERSHVMQMQSQFSQNMTARHTDAKESNAENPHIVSTGNNSDNDCNSGSKVYNFELNRLQDERMEESEVKNKEDEIRTNNQNNRDESEHMREFLNVITVDAANVISFLQGVDRHIEDEADLDSKVGFLSPSLFLYFLSFLSTSQFFALDLPFRKLLIFQCRLCS
jgi:hypothetical protein